MITDDEVLRLFERADPALTDDAAPAALDAAGYLDALRTRSSNVDYNDTQPTLTEPPTNRHRWLTAAAAAAAVAVIAGGLVLAARDDDDRLVATNAAPATEAPATTDPTLATTPAVEDAGTRVGFVGLPPEGATPSTSEGGEFVVSLRSCVTMTGPLSVSEASEIDRLPPLGALWVLADGRLIWLKYENLPEGANSLSTGLLEQRLTPEGVELMRSEATAAFSSGEPHRCGPRDYDIFYVPAAGGLEGNTFSADDEHLARVIDPWSWLPATAWEDAEIRAYVPSSYLVSMFALEGSVEPDQVAAQLPAAAVDLLGTKVWEANPPGRYYATFTTDEARALAAALDDAGLERDGLLNAYQLDYQDAYHDESGETVMHIVFSPFAAAGVGCEGVGLLCRPGV